MTRVHMPFEVCTCPNPRPGKPFHCAATVVLPADRPPEAEPEAGAVAAARMEAAVNQMRQVLTATGVFTVFQVDRYAGPFTEAVLGAYLSGLPYFDAPPRPAPRWFPVGSVGG